MRTHGAAAGVGAIFRPSQSPEKASLQASSGIPGAGPPGRAMAIRSLGRNLATQGWNAASALPLR